jgi:hypothetical protein
MTQGAHVRESDVFQDFDSALSRFAERAENAVAAVESEAREALARLDQVCRDREDRVEQCRQRVFVLEDELSGCDDEEEDCGSVEAELDRARRRFEEAERALEDAEGWTERVEEEFEDYLVEARRFASAWQDDRRNAQQFLRGKRLDIEAYAAIGAPGMIDAGPENSAAMSSSGSIELEAPSSEGDQEAREAARFLERMPELRPGVWSDLSLRERLESVNRIESTMARLQGRLARVVVLHTFPTGIFGEYDASANRIRISEAMIKERSPAGLQNSVRTVLHEGRHAYQRDAIAGSERHSDPTAVLEWAHNLEPGNYLDPSRYSLLEYQRQPVERDAFAYEESVWGMLDGGSGRIG